MSSPVPASPAAAAPSVSVSGASSRLGFLRRLPLVNTLLTISSELNTIALLIHFHSVVVYMPLALMDIPYAFAGACFTMVTNYIVLVKRKLAKLHQALRLEDEEEETDDETDDETEDESDDDDDDDIFIDAMEYQPTFSDAMEYQPTDPHDNSDCAEYDGDDDDDDDDETTDDEEEEDSTAKFYEYFYDHADYFDEIRGVAT